MTNTKVFFHWKNPAHCRRYSRGVSLHSHTLHSRECLSFVTPVTDKIPFLNSAIQKHKDGYRERNGRDIEVHRAWWTPPLSARHAWQVEKDQIEHSLGLDALVSLSDHDNIEAGTLLLVAEPSGDIPTSVEWTVPFRETFFHLGVHNLPVFEAQQWMREFKQFTALPDERVLRDLLESLQGHRETLIVFNHPMWDEKGIGAGIHESLLQQFLNSYQAYMHAFELNGLRPWKENEQVIRLSESRSVPLISGGDRHAREPNACLNLTNAVTFAEFVEEIRSDGHSDVLFMPQYRENYKLRIIQSMCEVLRRDPQHGLGWELWTDRIFYLCDDGEERSLTELWGKQVPGCINNFVALMSLVEEGWLRSAMKLALPRKEEPA